MEKNREKGLPGTKGKRHLKGDLKKVAFCDRTTKHFPRESKQTKGKPSEEGGGWGGAV